MSGTHPNNPFASALHSANQGGAAPQSHEQPPPFQQEANIGSGTGSYGAYGGRTSLPSSPSAGTSAFQQQSGRNPFAMSNYPSQSEYDTQHASTMPSPQPYAASGQQSGLPASSSAMSSSTNPFQIPAPSQPAGHDSIADDLAGLDFGGGEAPAPASTNTTSGQGSATYAPPSVAPPDAQSPKRMAPPQATASSASATIAQPTSSQAAPPSSGFTDSSTGLRRYAPPAGPPPGMDELPSSTLSGQSDGQRQPHNQMAADEEYARKLWEAENDRAQRHQNRQGSGRRQQAPAAHTASSAPYRGRHEQAAYAAPAAPRDPNAEKEWNTKDIYWEGRSQRVIVQNENGPCSLIALCNVLLMRGTLQLTPADRPAVSYSYLSSLLGEHLIDAISTSADGALDLEAALSILPQTQEGLDVNVRFDAIDGFAVEQQPAVQQPSTNPFAAALPTRSSSSKVGTNADKEKQRGELALFKLCDVPLVHGWLADKSDAETWSAVVERAGDYDSALDRIVAGDELAKGQVVDPTAASQSASGSAPAAQGPDVSNMSSTDRQTVNDAMLISRFLESTATQLTYPGLHALSTTLQRGALYALFRNSHLSVIYRPLEEELQQAIGPDGDQQTHNQPQLYQLVTDATLENEDGIVWESLEDVDGSASRFFDGKFRVAHVSGDFAGRQPGGGQAGVPDEDADMAYAQQLQYQEQQRADRYVQQRNQQNAMRRQQQQQGRSGQNTDTTVGNQGNLISRLLANRKQGRKGRSTSQHFDGSAAGNMSNTRSSQRPSVEGMPSGQLIDNDPTDDYGRPVRNAAPGQEYEQPSGSGKNKWWKKIL